MVEETKQAPGLWDVAKSVAAALLGVQSSKNYKRDFEHGKSWQYIIVGLIAVIIFILIVVSVVKVVMSLAGI